MHKPRIEPRTLRSCQFRLHANEIRGSLPYANLGPSHYWFWRLEDISEWGRAWIALRYGSSPRLEVESTEVQCLWPVSSRVSSQTPPCLQSKGGGPCLQSSPPFTPVHRSLHSPPPLLRIFSRLPIPSPSASLCCWARQPWHPPLKTVGRDELGLILIYFLITPTMD